MSTLKASFEIRHLLEGPFDTHIGKGDVNRATQLATAVLKSLDLQGSEIISKEEKIQVEILSLSDRSCPFSHTLLYFLNLFFHRGWQTFGVIMASATPSDLTKPSN